MTTAHKRLLLIIILLIILALLLPQAVLRIWFLWEDSYPHTFRDVKILRSIRTQVEEGHVDLAAATSFDWDTVYYLSDIPLQKSIPALQDALGVDLRRLRKIRYEPFDLPAGHGLIFVKEGRFVEDCMLPLSCKLQIPTTITVSTWQYIEIAVLERENARLTVGEGGALIPAAAKEADIFCSASSAGHRYGGGRFLHLPFTP